jgi:hypothetical protein
LADPVFSFAYCLEEEVLGVGWQVPVRDGTRLTWETYLQLAIEEHGAENLSRVRYLHDNVKPGDLIWTRDTGGRYYLAKVEVPRDVIGQTDSAWEYFDTPRGRDADIVNVVRCRIVPVPQADDIPGKIVACFRPSRTIQAVSDSTTLLYSQMLWNQLAGLPYQSSSNSAPLDIFSFLDAETTEDVVFIYLQYQGWIVVPNSRRADTMRYEFVAIHRETYDRALVQVKTGSTPLAMNVWSGFREKVFLFQSHGIYTGEATPNVFPISPTTIHAFMSEHIDVMPRSVQRWIGYAKSIAQPHQ